MVDCRNPMGCAEADVFGAESRNSSQIPVIILRVTLLFLFRERLLFETLEMTTALRDTP